MNINKLMKQAQEMQKKLLEDQAATVVEASVGGGMVTVTMNGLKQLQAVAIDPEVLDPEDPSMVQDLVLAAVNEAGRKVDDENQKKLGGITGNLSSMLPGGF